MSQEERSAAQCCDKVYFCPTSGDTECPVHGGFDVCCDRPDLHRPVASAAKKSLDPTDCFLEGYQAGSDMAVDMARAGNLRVAAMPFERGQYPYSRPLRPWRITRLAWRSWWRERTNRG